jgi:general secretion pathway protein D
MIRALVLLLAAWSLPLLAADAVTLQFDEIRIAPLARVVLGDVLQVGYVLDAEVLKDDAPITIKTSAVTTSNAFDWLQSVVRPYGYVLTRDSYGVRLAKGGEQAEDMESFFYRPRFRSFAYIVELVRPFFPRGQWSFERAASVPGGTPNAAGAAEKPPAGMAANIGRINTDAFVYQSTPADIRRLRDFLAQVDTRTPEVVIRAAVYEVSQIQRDSSGVGLAVSLLSDRLGLNLARPVSGAWSASLNLAGIQAAFAALSSDTRFKSLSRPELRVASGATGRVTVGADVPVLGAVTTAGNGTVTQSVEYRSSGVILDVSPVVLDSIIELKVRQESSSFVQTSTGVNQSPTLLKRAVETRVQVEPGSLVVFGGLQETRTGDDASGWLFVPDWLKSKTRDNSETELVLVLHVESI